jgi:transcriptional antiterminator RfaH
MPENNCNASWFLAQLKPNSYRIAQRNLAQQGFATFLPMTEETRRLRGVFVTQLRPLFPGYIFVALDMRQGSWRAVNSTIGVTRLVRLGPHPTQVPTELIQHLQRGCDPSGRLRAQQHLTPGDTVMLRRGPFAEFVATIDSVAPDQRVWVLMEIMGASTRVAVSAENLSMAGHKTATAS